MGLTSEGSLKKIIDLYNLGFDNNSAFDRYAYLISIKFNQIEFGDWFHHAISHSMTGDMFSDGIEGFGELRGDLFYRGALAEHSENYEKVSDIMEAFVMKMVDMQKMCVECIKVCIANGDESYEDYLRNLNQTHITNFIKQATVMYTAVKQYEQANALYKWNVDFRRFVIPELKDLYKLED